MYDDAHELLCEAVSDTAQIAAIRSRPFTALAKAGKLPNRVLRAMASGPTGTALLLQLDGGAASEELAA